MKKFINVLVLVTAISSVSNLVMASEKEVSPEYNSTAIVTDKGMTEDYTYTFADGKVDSTPSDIILMVNGEFVPATGIIKNGTTFVPVRVISESFGKEVGWNSTKKQVTIDNITLIIGNSTATVGDKTVELPFAPFIKDGLTYVPLRFIAENLDKEVGYISKNNDEVVLDNSIVWIEDKDLMNNDGKTIEEMKKLLVEQLEAKGNIFIQDGAVNSLTNESIENMKYIGQLGRYAIFNSETPLLFDVKNNKIYIYFDGHGNSSIYNIDEETVDDVDGYQNKFFPLMAKLESDNIYLYEDKIKSQLFVVKDGETTYLDLGISDFTTPRFILPQMYYNDFDNDGVEELLIDIYAGSGTGVSFEELYLVEINNEDKPVYKYSNQDYVNNVVEKVNITVDEKSNKATVKTMDKTFIIDVTDGTHEVTFGDIANFEFEDNKIYLNIMLEDMVKDWVSPQSDKGNAIKFEVTYKDGKFDLTNPTMVK